MSARANAAATLFPLLLMGLLASLSYWLELASRTPDGANDGKSRHDPDYIVKQFSAVRFDADGRLQHSMVAAELRHYPDDDSTEIDAPRLTYHRSPDTAITANKAFVSSKGEQVRFVDTVRVVRRGPVGKEDSVLATELLDAWPDEEIARSDQPATLSQGLSTLQGSRFFVDNKTSFFALEGPVRGVFFRKDKAPSAPSATQNFLPPRRTHSAR